jgi:alkanesulfonate monooxygenase SsuD/methylene tetrahydromethanopterin reductase-like flavin-dependent oxidoreductase (luciferase family)
VPYYGKEAGDKLTALLRQHILIAVDVVAAAKANDQAKLQQADAKWKQNASDIAAFLGQANSNWPSQALTDAMNMHLATTTREVVDRLQKNYDDDVRAFDAVYDHILHMADVMADGIVKQFPDRF